MKNPLVVGYKGEIGSFILNGLLQFMPKANNIWCLDVNNNLYEEIERIKLADVIFLCVPIEETARWIAERKGLLKGKILIEQTSVKYYLFEAKNIKGRIKDVDILSMHILFRPSATLPTDRCIALIDHNKWNEELLGFIDYLCTENCFYYADYKEHDMDMAVQQTLVHKVLVTLDNLIQDDQNITFMSKRVKELAQRIKSGNSTLYGIIQNSKYKRQALAKFRKAISE